MEIKTLGFKASDGDVTVWKAPCGCTWSHDATKHDWTECGMHIEQSIRSTQTTVVETLLALDLSCSPEDGAIAPRIYASCAALVSGLLALMAMPGEPVACVRAHGDGSFTWAGVTCPTPGIPTITLEPVEITSREQAIQMYGEGGARMWDEHVGQLVVMPSPKVLTRSGATAYRYTLGLDIATGVHLDTIAARHYLERDGDTDERLRERIRFVRGEGPWSSTPEVPVCHDCGGPRDARAHQCEAMVKHKLEPMCRYCSWRRVYGT